MIRCDQLETHATVHIFSLNDTSYYSREATVCKVSEDKYSLSNTYYIVGEHPRG